MRTKTTTISLLLAGLLGAAGAWAETPPNATSDTSVGGQASTMTQGRPNMATTNEPAVATPAAAPTGTMGASSPMASDASTTTMTMGAMQAAPTQDHMRRGVYNSDPRLGTGESSTMVNGQPNANPDDPLLAKTRAERRSEREFKRADARTRREQAIMGQRSAPEPWQQPGGTPE